MRAGSPSPQRNERSRILAIDDSPEVIAQIHATLSDDCQVLAATSGETGLALASRHLPDLILLDVRMPGLDGFATAQHLKANPETRDTPIIFVTGEESEGAEVRGFELGAADYVRKPIEPATLRARVHTQLRLAGTLAALREAKARLDEERRLIAATINQLRESQSFCRDRLEVACCSQDDSSGDLILSARDPDGTQLVMLGDFTGHGLRAAIGAPLVTHLFHTLVGQGADMPEILAHINQVLTRHLPVHMFLATVAVAVPPRGGRVRLWNCGAPGVLHRQAGGGWQVFDSLELPLGIELADRPLGFHALDGGPGEILYLMSDGMTETPTRDGKPWGTAGVIQALERHGGDPGAVMSDLHDCKAPHSENDDITLVKVDLSPLEGMTHDSAER